MPQAARIFVSIASYGDPLLDFTLHSALTTAAEPTRLRFGVVDQSDGAHRLRAAPAAMREQVRYVHLDPIDARGPCFARAIAMSLFQGEDWFLQIDSHTWFEPGWDDRLIAWGEWARARNPRSLLTTYPNPFTMIDNEPVAETVTDRVLALVVRSGQRLSAADVVLQFEGVPVDADEPVAGFHLAAGCLFAPGRIVDELPYDPYLYFHGEEQSMALRAWTRGWDLWHPPAMPMRHEYVRGPVNRPLHWSPAEDARRAQQAAHLDALSRHRLCRLLHERADLGAFGLGHVRTLSDYAAFSGIDYAALAVTPRAGKQRFGHEDRTPA